MVHQYIYIVHGNTDQNGWQYRSSFSGTKEEQWVNFPLPHCVVRRRIWMTTIVPRYDLIRSKRLLSENLRIDNGIAKMEGDLLRYEKGTLTKSWQKRRAVLYHNRIEFYSGNSRKGEYSLTDCEVKMLFESQCPGKEYAFSIRNPLGSVGILLDAEDKETRRQWVIAIQYQLAMNSTDLNFQPLEYGPPTGEYPDNRVLLCSDLHILSRDGKVWHSRHFQLLPREIIFFENDEIKGRIFVEKATIHGDEKNLNFTIQSHSGLTLTLRSDTTDDKNLWLLGVRKQIQFIENQKLKLKTSPKEEQYDDGIPLAARIGQFYDEEWTAPAVDGEDEDYLMNLFTATTTNNPNSYEFIDIDGLIDEPSGYPSSNRTSANMQELTSATNTNNSNSSNTSNVSGIAVETSPPVLLPPQIPGRKPSFRESPVAMIRKSSFRDEQLPTSPIQPFSPTKSSDGGDGIGERKSIEKNSSTTTPRDSKSLKTTKSVLNLHQTTVKILEPKRSLINPKFILTVLKGLTHRFVLVLECESRKVVDANAANPVVFHPPRFTVGGPRACRDPRISSLNQLLGITCKKPEIQLPSGWLMLHQYIYVIQQNTDENGWQYRSNWSDGIVNGMDEQWVDHYNDAKYVRRRLWMTTVVKKEDLIKAKKMVTENLNGVKGDVIMSGNLYKYHPELGTAATSWQKRKVLLFHNKLEFYIGNDKKAEVLLNDCEVKMLFGMQCPGRNFAFSIRNPNGSVAILLDAETKEIRRKWIHAINYQLAIISPDLNFSPLEYGPPTGDYPDNRVLLCGELLKQGKMNKKWVKHSFQLKTRELLFYDSDILKGKLFLELAKISSRDDEQEFTIRFASGLIIVLRADTMEVKVAWVRAIKRQVQYIENVKHKTVSYPPEELDEYKYLLRKDRKKELFSESWYAPEPNPVDDDDYLVKLITDGSKNSKEYYDDNEDDSNSEYGDSQFSDDFISVNNDVPTAHSTTASLTGTVTSVSTANIVANNLTYGGNCVGDVKDTDNFKFITWTTLPKFTPKHRSAMSEFLTADLFNKLKDLKTKNQFTLSNVIQKGVTIPSVDAGATAGDLESYVLFQELFVPIIYDLHEFDPVKQKHVTDMSLRHLTLSPAQEKFFVDRVSFIRFNATRNILNVPFPAGSTDIERSEAEQIFRKAFTHLDHDEMVGEYYRLGSLTEEQKNFFNECNYLFDIRPNNERQVNTYHGHGHSHAHAPSCVGNGVDRSWPSNRGIFVNAKRSIYIFVNEEEHCRVVVTDGGANILKYFDLYRNILDELQRSLKKHNSAFLYDDTLGFLSSDPARLGTCLKISALVYLPHFNNYMEMKTSSGAKSSQALEVTQLFTQLCVDFELEAKGASGLYTPAIGGKFDVRTVRTLGITETQSVQIIIDGISALIEVDVMLEKETPLPEIKVRLEKRVKDHRMRLSDLLLVTGSPKAPANATLSKQASPLNNPKPEMKDDEEFSGDDNDKYALNVDLSNSLKNKVALTANRMQTPQQQPQHPQFHLHPDVAAGMSQDPRQRGFFNSTFSPNFSSSEFLPMNNSSSVAVAGAPPSYDAVTSTIGDTKMATATISGSNRLPNGQESYQAAMAQQSYQSGNQSGFRTAAQQSYQSTTQAANHISSTTKSETRTQSSTQSYSSTQNTSEKSITMPTHTRQKSSGSISNSLLLPPAPLVSQDSNSTHLSLSSNSPVEGTSSGQPSPKLPPAAMPMQKNPMLGTKKLHRAQSEYMNISSHSNSSDGQASGAKHWLGGGLDHSVSRRLLSGRQSSILGGRGTHSRSSSDLRVTEDKEVKDTLSFDTDSDDEMNNNTSKVVKVEEVSMDKPTVKPVTPTVLSTKADGNPMRSLAKEDSISTISNILSDNQSNDNKIVSTINNSNSTINNSAVAANSYSAVTKTTNNTQKSNTVTQSATKQSFITKSSTVTRNVTSTNATSTNYSDRMFNSSGKIISPSAIPPNMRVELLNDTDSISTNSVDNNNNGIVTGNSSTVSNTSSKIAAITEAYEKRKIANSSPLIGSNSNSGGNLRDHFTKKSSNDFVTNRVAQLESSGKSPKLAKQSSVSHPGTYIDHL